MYRVIAVVVGGLALAACSSNSQWLNFDALKPAPVVETVRFESTPPGADVKVSNGQTCRTPCALAIPHPEADGSYTAAFTLNGFLPDTEQIQLQSMGDNTSQLRPNPVVVQLTPAPPPPKKKVKHRRHVAKPVTKKPAAKRAAKPKPADAKSAPAPAQAQPQQAPSPWPPVQPQQR